MLPPGHIAAGYLLARSILTITKPPFNAHELSWLAGLGAFFAFVPDMDMFYAFIKERGFHHTGAKFSHRQFITHTPIFWLVMAGLVAVIGHTLFWRYVALMIWLGSWSHLFLDSSFVGIRWLYPFSKKFYALQKPGEEFANNAKGFFNHWWNLIKMYFRTAPGTFLLEIMLVVTALLIFFAQNR